MVEHTCENAKSGGLCKEAETVGRLYSRAVTPNVLAHTKPTQMVNR